MMKLADLDVSGTYSYADYLKWRFEERVELIRGRIFKMSPAPGRLHQRVSGDLYGFLWTYLRGKDCAVYSAPFDVRLARRKADDEEVYTVLQPDICVVCDAAKLDERGCIGAPDIVVEILSPSNNVKDLKYKYELYEEAGVQEYWVLSPQDSTVVVNTLIDGKYSASRLMVAGDVITSSVLAGFSLEVSQLFPAE